MSEINNVEQNKIVSNDETFTKGTYNGISIIIRDKDNYINATTMCNQFGKKFRKIFENHSWQSYLNEFKAEYLSAGIPAFNENRFQYIIYKGYLKEVSGTYIHPKLINYVAMWASPKYSIKVGKIMDAINENNFEKLSNEINDMKTQNYGLTVQT
jgi:hypothetical protein